MSGAGSSPTAKASLEMLSDTSLALPAVTPLTRSLSKTAPNSASKLTTPTKPQVKNRAEDDISVQPLSQADDRCLGQADDASQITPSDPAGAACPSSKIEDLPSEILELILGHVVGHLGSTKVGPHATRNWNEIMRHSRGKHISSLALVSPVWRRLIQERTFRHSRSSSVPTVIQTNVYTVKVKGTRSAIADCSDFFLIHTHLQPYVRHFQVQVPILELKELQQTAIRHIFDPNTSAANTLWRALHGVYRFESPPHDISLLFQVATNNATMSEIFGCAQRFFPQLYAITIESTNCKHPPRIPYFRRTSSPRISTPKPPGSYPHSPKLVALPFSEPQTPNLPRLPTAKALILKGAWNMARTPQDFAILAAAMPNLREFHTTYHVPKTEAYKNTCAFLHPTSFPPTIRTLHLALEGLITKPASSLSKWRKVCPAHHICTDIGAITPQLESLTYSGRICHSLFTSALTAAQHYESPCTRLKTIDILLTNVCRDAAVDNDGTGIHNWAFIQAFEALVLAFIRMLALYPAIRNVRVRFIDLDNLALRLNPSFHLDGDRAWGFWSEEILMALREVRPGVGFLGAGGEEDGEGVRNGGEWKWSVGLEYYRAMARGTGRGVL